MKILQNWGSKGDVCERSYENFEELARNGRFLSNLVSFLCNLLTGSIFFPYNFCKRLHKKYISSKMNCQDLSYHAQ